MMVHVTVTLLQSRGSRILTSVLCAGWSADRLRLFRVASSGNLYLHYVQNRERRERIPVRRA